MGNTPRREVFPLDGPATRTISSGRTRLAHSEIAEQLLVGAQVQPVLGERSVAPAWWRPAGAVANSNSVA